MNLPLLLIFLISFLLIYVFGVRIEFQECVSYIQRKKRDREIERENEREREKSKLELKTTKIKLPPQKCQLKFVFVFAFYFRIDCVCCCYLSAAAAMLHGRFNAAYTQFLTAQMRAEHRQSTGRCQARQSESWRIRNGSTKPNIKINSTLNRV